MFEHVNMYNCKSNSDLLKNDILSMVDQSNYSTLEEHAKMKWPNT